MNPIRITIVGVGLIGGSLALALKRAGLAQEIVGTGSRPSTLARAKELGVIDIAQSNLGLAVAQADLVVLAVPVGSTKTVISGLRNVCTDSVVITDVGSTKQSVVEAVRAIAPDWESRFVPGHPVAGTEKSGPEAAFDSLFDGRRVILTPSERTDKAATEFVAEVWRAAGAEVCEMTPSHHDRVLGATSHLPHVLASSLVNCLANQQEHDEILQFAAGGFADFTRIASSHPAMWRDIVEANQGSVMEALDRFSEELAQFRSAIAKQDWGDVEHRFQQAREERAIFLQQYAAKQEEGGA